MAKNYFVRGTAVLLLLWTGAAAAQLGKEALPILPLAPASAATSYEARVLHPRSVHDADPYIYAYGRFREKLPDAGKMDQAGLDGCGGARFPHGSELRVVRLER